MWRAQACENASRRKIFMARSVSYSTRAIVLRTRLLGEKDRIMTLLSPDEGRFSAVAKGARNPKSKLAAVSQPFMEARFLLSRGRNLDIATQAEIERAPTHITGDLARTAWATYLCELCDAVPERQPDKALFELLALSLQNLDSLPVRRNESVKEDSTSDGSTNDSSANDSSANAASTDREEVEDIGFWFEARLLALLGYAPTVGRCVSCGEKIVVAPGDVSQRVSFSPLLGGTLCGACSPRDSQRMSLLAQALRVWHSLERAPAPSSLELTTAARRDLREGLRRSLRAHLELKLRSQKFLDDVMSSPPPEVPAARLSS